MDCRRAFFLGGLFRQSMAISLLFVWLSAHAELVLTAPPRESAADGQKQYGPLAAELTDLLGEKVVYQHPKGWLYYQRDMRNDKFDIVFDGPHFISWRIKQFDHTPVAKLPGKLGFVVVTNKENGKYEVLNNLINVPICVIAPPNLATLTVLARFENPARQPRLISSKGGAAGVYEAFKNGECKAVILRDKFYDKKIPQQERDELKVIFRSIPVTNQGITVSSRVSEDKRDRIVAALTEVSKSTAPILKRFASKVDKMTPASEEDYDDHYKLLTGVIIGWEITNSKYVRAESFD